MSVLTGDRRTAQLSTVGAVFSCQVPFVATAFRNPAFLQYATNQRICSALMSLVDGRILLGLTVP